MPIARLCTLLLVLACTAAAEEAASPVRWERLPDMPAGVCEAAVSRSGRSAVVTGGINGTGQPSARVQVLDLDRLEWSEPLRLPRPRCFHAQVTLADGRVLVIGGKTGRSARALTALDDGVVIDLSRRTAEATPAAPHALRQPTMHLLDDGRVAVIGGPAASIFDPQRMAWERHIPLHEPREAHASAVLPDGRILVAGGLSCDSFELIDLDTSASRLLRVRLPGPTDDLRVVSLPDGRAWVLGGQDTVTGETLSQTWALEPQANEGAGRLVEGPSLGIRGGVADPAVAQLGPWVLVAGGESERDLKDRELHDARLLDTRTLKVWSLPPLSVPHDGAAALADGRSFIVFGGYRRELGLPAVVKRVERLVLPADRVEAD